IFSGGMSRDPVGIVRTNRRFDVNTIRHLEGTPTQPSWSLVIVMVAVLGLLVTSSPVLAHHSFAAEFDASKPLKLTGTVTKLEWTNPHTWFFVDVKGEDGKVT